jgi:hypothetical protein
MSYQLMAVCCGQSIRMTDVQDQIDLQRWEDDGGAPARHSFRATACEHAARAEARQASAADNRARAALSID